MVAPEMLAASGTGGNAALFGHSAKYLQLGQIHHLSLFSTVIFLIIHFS